MKRREALRNISTLVALMATRHGHGAIAEAQQPAKVAKIAWLARAASATRLDLFRRELRQLGYVEGKNIAIESRNTEPDRLSALIDELVRLKVDVIVTASTNDALAAKNASSTIPIVFYNVTDPIAAGLVDSLARPGGGERHGNHQSSGGVDRQTVGVAEGNGSQAFPRCSAVES